MPALSLTLCCDCARASECDTVHKRGGAVNIIFIEWFSSNDWTNCGRMFHTSVHWYISGLFMFNRHIYLNMLGCVLFVIESFPLM